MKTAGSITSRGSALYREITFLLSSILLQRRFGVDFVLLFKTYKLQTSLI